MKVQIEVDPASLTEAQQQVLRDELKRELALLAQAIVLRMVREA